MTVELEPGIQHGHLSNPYEEAAQRSIDRIVQWLDARDPLSTAPFAIEERGGSG